MTTTTPTPTPINTCEVQELSIRKIVLALFERYGSENAAAIASRVSRRSLRRMAGTEEVRESPRPITYKRLAEHLAQLEREGYPLLVEGCPITLTQAELLAIGAEEFDIRTYKQSLVDHITLHLSEEDCLKLLTQVQGCTMENTNGTSNRNVEGLMRSLKKSAASTLQELIQLNIDERFVVDDPREAYAKLLGTNEGDLVDAIATLMEQSRFPQGELRYRLVEVLSTVLYKADENGLTSTKFADLDELLLFLTSD